MDVVNAEQVRITPHLPLSFFHSNHALFRHALPKRQGHALSWRSNAFLQISGQRGVFHVWCAFFVHQVSSTILNGNKKRCSWLPQSDPAMIKSIVDAVTIPVMAKVRIGHFVEAQASCNLVMFSLGF